MSPVEETMPLDTEDAARCFVEISENAETELEPLDLIDPAFLEEVVDTLTALDIPEDEARGDAPEVAARIILEVIRRRKEKGS